MAACFRTLIVFVRVIAVIAMCSAVTLFSLALISMKSLDSYTKSKEFLWINFDKVFNVEANKNYDLEAIHCLIGINIFLIFYAFASVLLLYSTVAVNRTWTYPWMVLESISTLSLLWCFVMELKNDENLPSFIIIYAAITIVGAFLFLVIVFFAQLTWPKKPLSNEYLKNLSSDDYFITFPPYPYGSSFLI